MAAAATAQQILGLRPVLRKDFRELLKVSQREHGQIQRRGCHYTTLPHVRRQEVVRIKNILNFEHFPIGQRDNLEQLWEQGHNLGLALYLTDTDAFGACQKRDSSDLRANRLLIDDVLYAEDVKGVALEENERVCLVCLDYLDVQIDVLNEFPVSHIHTGHQSLLIKQYQVILIPEQLH